MTTSTTNNCTYYGKPRFTTWNCNTTDVYFNRNDSSPQTKYKIKLQSPLGIGKIAEMALFCEDLELHPKCQSSEGIGYLIVETHSKEKSDKINKKADVLGFTEGDVEPKGNGCKCSTL